MAGGPADLISSLLSPRVLASLRPITVALIAIALCLLLFRPRRKPQQPQRPTGTGATAGAGTSTSARLPATSISTRGVLLEFEGGRPRLLPGAVDAVLRLAKCVDVYLVTTLPEDSDALEAATLEALASGGLFAEGGCERRKALFCSTEDGRSAIARQLNPAVHVDTSPKVLQYLAPHLPRVVFVHASGASLEGGGGSAVSARSLADYAAMHCAPARGA